MNTIYSFAFIELNIKFFKTYLIYSLLVIIITIQTTEHNVQNKYDNHKHINVWQTHPNKNCCIWICKKPINNNIFYRI